jgi:hypothetical protein
VEHDVELSTFFCEPNSKGAQRCLWGVAYAVRTPSPRNRGRASLVAGGRDAQASIPLEQVPARSRTPSSASSALACDPDPEIFFAFEAITGISQGAAAALIQLVPPPALAANQPPAASLRHPATFCAPFNLHQTSPLMAHLWPTLGPLSGLFPNIRCFFDLGPELRPRYRAQYQAVVPSTSRAILASFIYSQSNTLAQHRTQQTTIIV